MILKLRIGHFRITFTITPVIDVVGVNSKLPDGNHILMWDFDHTNLLSVVKSLLPVQRANDLPDIYVLETTENVNFIAYCFKSVTLTEAISILGSTNGICYNFFKWGIFRRRFTLRVSPKCGRTPKLVLVLSSDVRETATITELRSWVKYETLQDDKPNRIIKLGEPKCPK